MHFRRFPQNLFSHGGGDGGVNSLIRMINISALRNRHASPKTCLLITPDSTFKTN